MYIGKGKIKVKSYVDTNFIGDVGHLRSTIDYIFIFDIGEVSWISQTQNIVHLSTTKIEYIAVTETIKGFI